jgi:pyruvate dehydrogenase E2 component (dihydrolipoamide acetyltransferase)
VQVQMDELMSLRQRLNAVSKVKISVNDLVIKAAALACLKVPETNSSWLNGNIIRKYKNVNITFAVQTDHGLIVPVVQDANLKVLLAH